MTNTSKYYGLTVIKDYETEQIKNKHILELNSEEGLEYRYYDENCNFIKSKSTIVDIYTLIAIDRTMKECTGIGWVSVAKEPVDPNYLLTLIRKKIKKNNFILSENAVQFIEEYVENLNDKSLDQDIYPPED